MALGGVRHGSVSNPSWFWANIRNTFFDLSSAQPPEVFFCNGADRQTIKTDGYGNSMTEFAPRADSVKMKAAV